MITQIVFAATAAGRAFSANCRRASTVSRMAIGRRHPRLVFETLPYPVALAWSWPSVKVVCSVSGDPSTVSVWSKAGNNSSQ